MAKGNKRDSGPGRARELTKEDVATLKLISATAETVQKRILERDLPELKFPTRSLGNVKYNTKIGYFQLGFVILFRPWAAPDPRSKAHIGIGAFNLLGPKHSAGFALFAAAGLPR